MVLRELRSIEAVIPRFLAPSFAQSRSRSRARRILAARETVLDRQDPFRQINLADPQEITQVISLAESLGTARWTDSNSTRSLDIHRGTPSRSSSIDLSSASSKCAKQKWKIDRCNETFARTIYLENFVFEKLHLIRITSEHRAALDRLWFEFHVVALSTKSITGDWIPARTGSWTNVIVSTIELALDRHFRSLIIRASTRIKRGSGMLDAITGTTRRVDPCGRIVDCSSEWIVE